MGLKEVLSKMKIVEIDPDEAAAAVPPAAARSVTNAPGAPGPRDLPPPPSMPRDIRDLLGAIPEPPAIDERKLPPESVGEEGGDIPDFPAIYRAAGVVDPPHGYSAYKVLEIFASPGFAALDLRAKAAALTGFLNMSPSGPVPITDVVQDAVRRDQALDKFEEFLRNKLGMRSEQMDKENAQLQAEIDEVTRRNREKMEANRAALDAEQARFTRWLNTKRAEERKLFEAVNPFVEKNPISTADTPRPAAPAAPET
jgi:Skp family chaperone for outer membrane proteins